MVVAECDRDCISIISCSGEKESFGSLGPGPDHFHSPNGVAIDKGGNILVADRNNHIQQLSVTGKFLRAVGTIHTLVVLVGKPETMESL